MKNIGIRYKILGFFVVLILGLTMLSTSYHSNRMKALVLISAQEIQTKFTEQIGFSLAEPLDYGLSDEVERLLVRAKSENPEIKYIRIYNRDHGIIHRFGHAPKIDFAKYINSKKVRLFVPDKNNEFLTEYFYKVEINTRDFFHIRIGFDNIKYQTVVDDIVYDYLKISYAVVILVLIIGFFFFRKILLVPLESLLNEMVSVRRSMTGSHQSEIESTDEVDYIRNYFKTLIDSIKDKNNQLKDLNTNLELKVEERTQELKQAQNKLLDTAHMAGMATMAAGVLHNIGNILTLASNSAESLKKLVKDSSIQYFPKIKEHVDSLAPEKKSDEVQKILNAYCHLAGELSAEQEKIQSQLDTLVGANRTMLKTVQSQQKYAQVGDFKLEVNLEEVINDSIQLMSESLGRHRININFESSAVHLIQANKANLLNVFVNLLLNAKESILQSGDLSNDMKINITLNENDTGEIIIIYTDSGVGIEYESMENLFKFGYTTKDTGSGFGLHDAANTIRELGGEIFAFSEGKDKGASFEIRIP
ncbi:MAG: hypothetical protein BM556_17675 [Bacteriovorax sp. MedPE-SWde]|nr:MAG: hypothetical protein BM556_17675 [Bacteriovorax sp. MedPE-SWde]